MNNRTKIHQKIRKTVRGTIERPRLGVYRSLSNIYAQLIDDSRMMTLVSANSLKINGSLTKKAELVGKKIAELASAKKITKVVFDRGGFAYRGAIKKLAEEARKNGLEF